MPNGTVMRNVPMVEAIPVARSEALGVAAELARWQGGEDAPESVALKCIDLANQLKRAVDPLIVAVRVPGP